MASVDENEELNGTGSPEIDQGIESGSDSASGKQDVVDKDYIAAGDAAGYVPSHCHWQAERGCYGRRGRVSCPGRRQGFGHCRLEDILRAMRWARGRPRVRMPIRRRWEVSGWASTSSWDRRRRDLPMAAADIRTVSVKKIPLLRGGKGVGRNRLR